MVVSWATSNILWLHHNQRSDLEMPCEEPLRNETLLSKILRWLVASVILGRISCISHGRSGDHGRKNNSLEILQTFLKDPYEKVKTVGNCSVNDTLAITILYLQNHLLKNSDSLPSVVMALCLFILDASSKQGICCRIFKLIMKISEESELIYQLYASFKSQQ
jgi:nucleolar pre-ribosomal-associated protein 1